MDLNKNYYHILDIDKDVDNTIIKKKYFKLSFKYHPDKNKDVDTSIFNDINEAYRILMDTELRDEYDRKSKWGRFYDETYELYNLNIDFSYNDGKQQLEKFKKYQINNIQLEIDNNFDGNLEYQRWVKCKKCDGTGKDVDQKIVIKDKEGNILKTFEGEDGCDYCEGLGTDYRGNDCKFCNGKGKVGISSCQTCNGERRIFGKQKIKNIKLTGDETKIESMGHYSTDGTIGYLLLRKK